MYTELEEVSEAKGKTVQGITCASDRMIMAFTDETFLIFAAVEDFDGVCGMAQQELDFEDFFRGELVTSGIITKEEWQQEMKERNEKRNQAREVSQRRQYARLKAKFEHGE